MQSIEADYLVIGAGAMGMAFVDTLIAETDATVVLVDRNDQPGGHWVSAYPFVRLHQLASAGQRLDRRQRVERGLLRARRRQRGVRLLRPGHASAPAAEWPGLVLSDE
jgi:cation diffusion facilitator CzcD-associated flavoprotein CzcO